MRADSLKNISFLQFFGITLVVIGHAGSTNEPRWFTLVHEFIYTFHMPLFFAISGYLWNSGLEKRGRYDIQETVKSKAIRLLLPYLIITLIAFPLKTALSAFAYRPVDFRFADLIRSFLYPWENPIIFFWYLPALFIIFLISLLILNKKHNKQILFTIAISSLVIAYITRYIYDWPDPNFLALYSVTGHYYFFIFGYILFEYRHITVKNNFLALTISFSIFLLIALSLWVPFLFQQKEIMASLGIVASFLVAAVFQSAIRNPVIKTMSEYSYQIFLLSWFPQTAVRILLIDKHFLDLPFAVSLVISVICSIIFPVLVGYLVMRRAPYVKKAIGF